MGKEKKGCSETRTAFFPEAEDYRTEDKLSQLVDNDGRQTVIVRQK